MVKKSEDFSMQEIMHLAKSPAGQQLLAMLQRSDSGKVQQAADLAAAGKYDQAAQALQGMLSSPEAQMLIKQLGG